MPFNEDGSRKAAYKKSGFKMKGWSAGEGTGSSFKKDPKEKKYKPSDPGSDEFWEPGGMHQIMTKRGYKWDGTNFVKK